jgi:DNA-binding NarL/FixJ family response regulator
MDMRMPVLDGLEATRRLRAMETMSQVVIVAVSASAFAEQREQYSAVGANDFLAKPVQYATLLELLRQHLGLEWVCADSAAQGATVATAVAPASMLPLGPEDLAILLDLARCGDVKRLLEHLTRLEAGDARYAPFVAQVRTLAAGFQIQQICALLTTMQG